ncbi:hypothetical protein FIBSPDRAFT_993537 [Athelia psychrophila]|uniref:Cytochrome P450 n=1 Tax=Athelia psychrophila TaxID=1759441 RepID=A0A165YBD9_9AGAM|nr:hypothetical protein FIBSPDRAFT_993537 [Fibularhizoctonia sp. CBS 109695]
MAHILSHSDIYQKSNKTRRILARIFGEGLEEEDDDHKCQRRIMNPGFGATQIRALTSVFTDKALMLRDRWSSELFTDPKGTRIDVLKWLNLAALDVIGQAAGFNYQFSALDPASPINELNEAFKNLFNVTQIVGLFLLPEFIPILRYIVSSFSLYKQGPPSALNNGNRGTSGKIKWKTVQHRKRQSKLG